MSTVIWFTGLSGAGKTTISCLLAQKLSINYLDHSSIFTLDGDLLRTGLCKDLGFTMADRSENVRRAAEVSSLLAVGDHIVIVALISPLAIDRLKARKIVEDRGCRFIEIFVNTPLSVAEKRDVKGLYKSAREGSLSNFAGIDLKYEVPVNPDLIVDTVNNTPDQSVDRVIDFLLYSSII